MNRSKWIEEYKKNGVVLDENGHPIPSYKIQDETFPWIVDHPGWQGFTSHKTSKWKNRFVVTGLNGEQREIIALLNVTTGLHYSCIEFMERDLFPDQKETYLMMCAYFFPTEERDFCAKLSPSEVNETYWY